MYSLIGDRFLKQFFGNRLHLHRVNLASEVESPMENEEEKPTEPGYSSGEDPLENEATLENEQDEVNQLTVPEIGSTND
jgi:hypothetical protein